ncbi:protein ACCELERATED CELL DEATH 6-like [Rosa rugosa]|uniref:protein ACCELERATED CELL DEATH 6-like n=1 Tax=Rosa rugosa TaxID=74645 RepID=UPI002B413657|nr:protein ACCELERATED CELL DEATH 6-like [Rosa rugosa]
MESTDWKRNKRGLIKSGARLGQRVSRDKDDDTEVHVKKGDEDPLYKEIKESHLVVSTLITTVAFAAAFTMPGGYQSEKGPDQGFAVLSRNAAFKAFVITNTLAMSMSACAVMIRLFSSTKGEVLVSQSFDIALSLTSDAMHYMWIAFLTGTYAVLGGHSLGLAIAYRYNLTMPMK